MVRDLEEGDKCAKELLLVKDNLSMCEIKNEQMDSLLSIAETKEILYENNIANYESVVSTKDQQIQNLNSQVNSLKKSKKLITFGGIVAVILTILL